MSRHHADLNVIVSTCSYSAGRINSSLVMKDVSKFAQTTVNGHLLSSKQREVTLKPGDVVQFGACPDTFSIDYRNLVACVYDFENRPEYQALAFRTGTPISETIENSAFVIADAIETENLGVCVLHSHLPNSIAHSSCREIDSHHINWLLGQACGDTKWCPNFP